MCYVITVLEGGLNMFKVKRVMLQWFWKVERMFLT